MIEKNGGNNNNNNGIRVVAQAGPGRQQSNAVNGVQYQQAQGQAY